MSRHHRAPHPARRFHLNTRQRWSIYGTFAVLWLTGCLWLIAHFFLRTEGEMGAIVNPIEPWSLKVHGAAILVFAVLVGSLWPVHIKPAWRAHQNRRTGAAMVVELLLLAASGYLLYYGSGDTLRDWVGTIHWIFGLVVPALVWLHVGLGRRRA